MMVEIRTLPSEEDTIEREYDSSQHSFQPFLLLPNHTYHHTQYLLYLLHTNHTLPY